MGWSHWKYLVVGCVLAACGESTSRPDGAVSEQPVTGEDAAMPDAGLDPGSDAAAEAPLDGEAPVPCEEAPDAGAGGLVALGACGRLVYGSYANRAEERADHRVPDFSFAGFGRGGQPIPDDVPTVETVSPGPGDDRARIQAAIDAAAARSPDARGYHGAVLLTRGRYEVSGPLLIAGSGLVLRGEGQAEDRSVLVATSPQPGDLVVVRGPGEAQALARTPITSDHVPVGATRFAVLDASGLAVGDRVHVMRTPNQAWLDALSMAQLGWQAAEYAVAHPRRIVAIDGTSVQVDVPLVDALAAEFGGGELVRMADDPRSARVGIEDLRFEAESAQNSALVLENLTQGFARRVTAVGFGHAAITVRGASEFVTIEDAAALDSDTSKGEVENGFLIEGGHGVLIQRSFVRGAEHGFAVGPKVAGPNVVLDSVAEQTLDDDGPQGSWATGLLFDNMRTASLGVQNRAQGWAGAQVMFYNVDGALVLEAPEHAMNWALGCTGERGAGEGMWESFGTPVEPRSLYLQQLRDRLGPEALPAVSSERQRAGRVWEALSAWAGRGKPD